MITKEMIEAALPYLETLKDKRYQEAALAELLDTNEKE